MAETPVVWGRGSGHRAACVVSLAGAVMRGGLCSASWSSSKAGAVSAGTPAVGALPGHPPPPRERERRDGCYLREARVLTGPAGT